MTNENILHPVLFIGHGSPMNALAMNPFTKHLEMLGQTLPKPKKILMISAHWVTNKVEILGMETPKTIHDFYGFPKELYDIQYPAKGHLELAQDIQTRLSSYHPILNDDWGFDHGAWSVLHHMYPRADIPVVQLSLSTNFLNLRDHYLLGQELKNLRKQGVLIIGSGNIVHNLRNIDRNPEAKVQDWALEFDEYIKNAILSRNLEALSAENKLKALEWKMAHPSIEHYLPLLYTLGATSENEKIIFPFESFEHGSLSMRSVLIG